MNGNMSHVTCFISRKRGFTLLEILVAMGIIAIISIVIAQAFFNSIKANNKAEIIKDAKQSGEFALGVMSQMIRSASDVTSTCDGTTANTLTISNSDGGSTTFGCVQDGTIMRIASTSGTTQYLSSSNLTLGGATCADPAMTLKFTCTTIPGQPPNVLIQFSMSQKGVPPDVFNQASSKFQTQINLRNE